MFKDDFKSVNDTTNDLRIHRRWFNNRVRPRRRAVTLSV